MYEKMSSLINWSYIPERRTKPTTNDISCVRGSQNGGIFERPENKSDSIEVEKMIRTHV